MPGTNRSLIRLEVINDEIPDSKEGSPYGLCIFLKMLWCTLKGKRVSTQYICNTITDMYEEIYTTVKTTVVETNPFTIKVISTVKLTVAQESALSSHLFGLISDKIPRKIRYPRRDSAIAITCKQCSLL